MGLKFSVEDVEVNINIDGDDDIDDNQEPEMDVINSLVHTSERKNLSIFIEHLESKLSTGMEILNNYENLVEHYSKFDISKEVLDILNRNNELGMALNLDLPRFESLSDIESFDLSSISKETLLISIEEASQAVSSNLVQKFITYSKHTLDWFVGFFSSIQDAKNTIRKYKNSILLDEEQFKTKRVGIIDAKTLRTRMDSLPVVINALKAFGQLGTQLMNGSIDPNNVLKVVASEIPKLEPFLEAYGCKINKDSLKVSTTLIKDKMGLSMAIASALGILLFPSGLIVKSLFARFAISTTKQALAASTHREVRKGFKTAGELGITVKSIKNFQDDAISLFDALNDIPKIRFYTSVPKDNLSKEEYTLFASYLKFVKKILSFVEDEATDIAKAVVLLTKLAVYKK